MNKIPLNIAGLDGGVIIKKGGGGGATIKNQDKSLEIVENGSVSITPDVGYTGLGKVNVNVDVPTQEINNQEKSLEITENGVTEVTADAGFTGLSKVVVNTNVQSGGGGGSDMPVIGDGKTYLYISIAAEGRMDVPLYFQQTVANGVTIDWGDGSAPQTLSGTGNVNTTHRYAAIGDYVISLNPAEGCTLGLGHSSSSYCVMGSTSNNDKVYCNMLTAVEIGKGATSINTYAFRGCYSLASIVIPKSVTSINTYTFDSCYSLASVVIPEGVTSIGNSAFISCYSLASIVIPESVKHIGSAAFNNCHSLASIVIPKSVTSIGANAFNSCYSLASVVIPEGVKYIDTYVFNKCYSLASVVIPEGVTDIFATAFRDCYSLASIVIPKSVTSIGANAFYNCYSLASVVIPEGVTSIGNSAFYNCYNVAFYDFSNCTSIPTLGNTSAFSNIPSDCKIIVPDALYDEWIAATNWSTYATYTIKKSDWDAQS